MPSPEDSRAAEVGSCSKSHQSLLTLPPSTWGAAGAAPQRKWVGKSVPTNRGPGASIGLRTVRRCSHTLLTLSSDHAGPVPRSGPDSRLAPPPGQRVDNDGTDEHRTDDHVLDVGLQVEQE